MGWNCHLSRVASPFIMFNSNFLVSGDECESYWYCFEAYFIRNKSASLSPDMGFYIHCFALCNDPNELLKQGNGTPFLLLQFVIYLIILSLYCLTFSEVQIYLVKILHKLTTFANCRHLILSIQLWSPPYTMLCSHLLRSWQVWSCSR